MGNIAVVIPTCREDLYASTFTPRWSALFKRHNVHVLTVHDAPDAKDITMDHDHVVRMGTFNVKEIMGENFDLIYNRNSGIKNVGFAYVARNLPEVEYIIALDDDVSPVGDPIADHISALNTRVPISWIPVGDVYTRGFPYCVRDEAEVVLSHGVWNGCPDLDAPTQMIRGTSPMSFEKRPIPKGVFYPMCEMNIAFKRKMLPFMYLAPDDPKYGFGRASDIWCGIESKKIIDQKGWAVVTGHATVLHERASNVWTNLKKEAKFIELNETFWKGDEQDPYFVNYKEKRDRWSLWIQSLPDQQ